MKLGRIGIVLVVVIALVGLYYFAPNLLMGVDNNEVRITPKYVNIPSYVPEDITVLNFIDGNPVGGSFVVDVGSTHSFTFRAMNPDGTIYAEITRVITAPSESGNYNLVIDGTTRMMDLVRA
jgi:hypothetical protein